MINTIKLKSRKKITIISFILLTFMILSSCAIPYDGQESSDTTGGDVAVLPPVSNTVGEDGTITPNLSDHVTSNNSPINIDDIEVFDNISELIDVSFADENRTNGAFYGDDVLEDPLCPKERIFIIKSQDDYNRIFTDEIENASVNYQSASYILYTYTTVYHNDFLIDTASVVGGELIVNFKLLSSQEPSGSASRPFQRFVLLKINRIDIEIATFIEID